MTILTQPANDIQQRLDNEYFLRKRELIQKINEKDITLSFSSLKEFAKSPSHFIAYKLRQKEQTKAMIEGSLLDVLLFTPDEFEDKFASISEGSPSTPQAVEFCNAILRGMSKIEAYEYAGYKNPTIEKANKSAQKYAPFIELMQTDKMIVDQKMIDQAKKEKNALMFNDASRFVLDQTTEVQKGVQWEYGGFKWRGFLDMYGEDMIADLKRMGQTAEPRKVKYKIFEMRYHWQLFLYAIATNSAHKLKYITAIDNACHVSVHEITNGVIQKAQEEIEYYLKQFKKCTFKGAWDQSYDFHAQNGIYKISQF